MSRPGKVPSSKIRTMASATVLDGAEIADLGAGGHGEGFTLAGSAEQRRKEPVAAIVEAGEGKGADNGEMAVEPLSAGTKEAVGGGFRSAIRVKGIDGVVLAAGPGLRGVDETGGDVDKVAVRKVADSMKKCDSSEDVEVNLLKPADLRRTHAGRGAVE